MAEDKLWVFDLSYLCVRAPTYEEADKQANIFCQQTGLDYDLAPDWRRYQEEDLRDPDLQNLIKVYGND